MSFDEYIGQRFGEYVIERLLGEGGIGAVFLARHEILDQPFAIKLLRKELGRQEIVQQRFFREARKAAAVRHENVVGVVNAGRHDETIYLVMEFVDGATVRDVLRDAGGRLPAESVADIGTQVLAGLAAAHEKSIIHRDIKPDNLIRMADGKVKIADFGLARGTDDDEGGKGNRLTNAGQILGTPAYMAPEQWDGAKIDPRCDLYALGVTLYQLLAGQLPFPGASPLAIAKKMLTEEAPPLTELVPGIDTGIVAIVRKLMARNRDERFETALKAQHALEKWRRGNLKVRKRSAVGSGGTTGGLVPAPPMIHDTDTRDSQLEIETGDDLEAYPIAVSHGSSPFSPPAVASDDAAPIPVFDAPSMMAAPPPPPLAPAPPTASPQISGLIARALPHARQSTPPPPAKNWVEPVPVGDFTPAEGADKLKVLSPDDVELIKQIEVVDDPPDVSDLVGTTVGGVYLREKIEGRVPTAIFAAEAGNPRQRVVAKVMRLDPSDTADRVQMILDRAMKATKLRHPHIVRTLAAAVDRDCLLITMEPTEGESLKDYLKENGPLPVPLATKWIGNLLHALTAAHRAGVYHGNLKPTNFLISHGTLIRIAEYGLPRRLLSGSNQYFGTPMYMAMEQWRGFFPGPAADLYSLGVTWFQMLIGRTPFLGRTAAQLVKARLTDDHFPPIEMRDDIPQWVSDLIMKLMAREPAQRPQSAEAVYAELQAKM